MDNELAKCSCQHCGGHIQFETAYAGADVACPHCGNQTPLYLPETVTTPAAPAPSSPAAGVRLAGQARAPAAGHRVGIAQPRRPVPTGGNSFARQAAGASAVAVFLVLALLYLAGKVKGPMQPILGLGGVSLLVAGLVFGVIGFLGMSKHGTKGILIPALFGTAVNGLLLVMVAFGVHAGWTKRQSERQRSSAAAVTPTNSTGSARQQAAAEPGQPAVTVLEPGTEPRKLLRLQPKPGTKQTAIFTATLAMEPGPFTNLPTVVETIEFTVKDVAANGDIAYESVIRDVRLLSEPGIPTQLPSELRAAFVALKGMVTSGTVSSRGAHREVRVKNPRSDQQLPAMVRMFHGQVGAALETAILPEESVGPGRKWEVKEESREGVKTTMYDIRSIENNRVTFKVTNTASGSAPKSAALALRASADITFDLSHIIPETGRFTTRMEDLIPERAGEKAGTMKIKMDLRIEPK